MTLKEKTKAKEVDLVLVLAAYSMLEIFALVYKNHVIRHQQQRNKELAEYAVMAQNFAEGLKPFNMSEINPEFSYCNDTNCMTCKAVRAGEREREQAMRTLNIDSKTVQALRQGPFSRQ